MGRHPVTIRRSLLPLGLLAAVAAPGAALAHSTAGGVELLPGEFRVRPVVTLEGHGGLENNLEGRPQHYAIDGLFGAVFEWGLERGGSFAIEAQLGPALVWGEAEHFYGRVHIEPPVTAAPTSSSSEEEEEEGDQSESHSEAHSDGVPYRRTDVKGYLQARYQPNDRFEVSFTWWPYYVSGDQGEDVIGLKNEIGVQAIWALGDGDVNFALGDGLETIGDGIFLSLENRTGWESTKTYLGNYTDPWVGLGFNVDLLNVTLSAGPRFYSPGSYANLPFRTDWGGELELEYPVSKSVVLFAHYKPIYTVQGGEGWGVGWQHHLGSGISLSF